jgi:RNA polymerase sigma-70 factor (ECF subfamily)
MTTTPASLLERLRSPTSAAWPEFVALYTPLLYHWTRRLGLPRSDAADLLQDVFVLLVRELPGFQYDSTRRFRAWLWTVFKNLWLARKRQAVRPEQPLGPGSLAELESENNVQEWQEEEYREHLVACALRVMRSEFHDTTWQACWAVVVEERSVAEVAAELNLTPNAVCVAKSRVLRRLRERLQGLLD